MDYATFASDLPAHGRMVFTSVEENEEAFRSQGVEQRMRQLGPGEYHSDLAVRITSQSDFYADRYNKALSMYLEPPAGMVGFLFPRSASGQFFASGEDLDNQRLLVFPEGCGADIVIPALAGSEAFVIPETRFIEMTEVLCPTVARPGKTAAFEGNTVRLRSLRMAVLGLVAHPQLEPSEEQLANFLAATVAWMGHSSKQWRPGGPNGNGDRAHIAKLGQEFIEEHYAGALRIEDLCRVTGVGVRTLQRAFRDYFDLSITDYIKTVRLDAAHRDLLTANPVECSVTETALRHGFAHLGRFSVEFRRRFGESPSVTLAARADRKTPAGSTGGNRTNAA